MPNPDRAGEGRRARFAYGAALLLLVASVFASIATPDNAFWASVAGVLQGLALLATLRVSRVPRRTLIRASALAVFATASAAGLTVVARGSAAVIAPLLWALVVLSAIVAIGRYVSGLGRVDLQTVLGLLCVYVLLGLFFAYAYMILGGVGEPFFTTGEHAASAYVYFSYVTLATVGYGDLTPVAGLPRALAVSEAIIGQLYLVTVVALAVSRLQGRRTS